MSNVSLKWRHVIGLLCAALIITLLWVSPFAVSLNGAVLDSQFKVLRNLSTESSNGNQNDNIVVIGIDERTYEFFDRPSGLWHHYIGEVLSGLAEAKPKLVVMDLIFEKLYRTLVPNHYSELHRSLLRFRKSSIPLVMAVALKNSDVKLVGDASHKKATLEEVFPYPAMRAILKDDAYFGLALIEKDQDNVMRRQSMVYENCQDCSPSMLARVYEQLGETHSPGLINFSVGAEFDYISLHQVVKWVREQNVSQLNLAFAGKSVFVGTVTRFEDRHIGPVRMTAWEGDNRMTPGVLFMAQAMRSIDSGGLIQPARSWLIALFVMLAFCLWALSRRIDVGLVSLSVFVISVLLFSTWSLTVQEEFPTGTLLMAGLVVCITRFSFEAANSFLERRRLTSSFGGYVSPNVMKEILDGKIRPDMKGARRNVCVMFADIRNFTTRSESSTPEAIIDLLNLYFEEMTAAIDEYGGTVDKFIGDGLMVFFGAPNSSANPSEDGFNAAKKMLERLKVVNQTLDEQGIEPIEIGIGLHTGEAVIGHVGSVRRNEYTAIGDTVNVAARLEGLTKALESSIVFSETVFADIDNDEQTQSLGQHKLKGHTPIPVYGWNSSVSYQ
ncbi:adenylate/guanylate cyclase domain-containing protein [Arenicella sp. 4NH20-0111]|uniref:adenylate/guanylate cyclase domain-containing protein n=1 Tax=Arenicella sp. 4NH20-0111 TaxID=3127648 RepID=UPI00333E550E